MNFKVIHYESVPSTQLTARTILQENVVIVADKMTSGYGRMRRKWHAPRGGLWATIILDSRGNIQLLNLAGGVAITKALLDYGVVSGLKWPNDVLVKSRKICGILSELYRTKLLMGIGLNLNNKISGELKETAISVKDILHQEVDRDQFLSILLSHIAQEVYRQDEEIIYEWKKYQITIGRRVKVIEKDYAYNGIAVDIDKNGFLQVKTENRIRTLVAGDLRFVNSHS